MGEVRKSIFIIWTKAWYISLIMSAKSFGSILEQLCSNTESDNDISEAVSFLGSLVNTSEVIDPEKRSFAIFTRLKYPHYFTRFVITIGCIEMKM